MNIRIYSYIWYLILVFPILGNAQCPISYSGLPCVGNPIQFEVAAPGATGHLWNFNGEGLNNTSATPTFAFNSTGAKTITYTGTLPGGKPCSATMMIVVKDKPKVKISLLSNPVQCYENNMFCISDSSLSGDNNGCIKTVKYLFSDGELITKYGSKNKPVVLPATICKTFVDPQGGDYTLTVEIEDCNGCMIKMLMPFTMKVQFIPAVFATSDALSDKCKGTVNINFKNFSQISQTDVLKFKWDFGDGTGDSTNWDSVRHTYSAGTDMVKTFNPRLLIYTSVGCLRVFNLDPVVVFNLKPSIIADKDSICFGDAINWELLPSQMKSVIKEENVRWYFEGGYMPGYTASSSVRKLGPSTIRCIVQHPCGPFELIDTITVIGPRALYEPAYMDAFRRYQCTIRDTVKAVDRSLYYHNDDDFLDDDSLFSEKAGNFKYAFKRDTLTGRLNPLAPYDLDRGNEHIDRTWNFDDDYCQPCTKNRKTNQNTWLNCKYSKDSMDEHWYTPWDSIYRYLYAKKYFNQAYFNPILKTCSSIRIWVSDSLYIVRDTVLNYGDNKLGISAKDSGIFKSITRKNKIPSGLFDDGILDLPFDLRLYVPAGNKLLIDKRDGSPQFQLNGPQFYDGTKNYRIITDAGDSCFFIYGLETHEDLLAADMIQAWHRVIQKIPTPGLSPGDSVNASLHRKLFYDKVPRCFNMSLTLRDTVHPLKCQNIVNTPVALLPPSAKRLAMVDQFCDGYNNKVINFELAETKPGCMSSFAKFNPDYINTPDNWILINDLNYGEMYMGTYNFSLAKYPGYGKGPNYTDFYWVYNDTVLSNKSPQAINVGLIIGNGVDPYACVDTVFYNNFATFPKLSADIVYAGTNSTVNHMCLDTFIYVTIPRTSPNDKLLADQSSWCIVNNTSSDTLEMVTEYYHKIKDHYLYPGKKINYTVVERSRLVNKQLKVYKTDTVFTAIVHAWKAVALPGAGFIKLREEIAKLGMNIDDFNDTTVLDFIWNRVGTIGVPSSGSKGCIDTTGYGHQLDYYYKILSSTILNYMDTSLLPADQVLINSKVYQAYAFRPDKKGTFSIYRSVTSFFPSFCPVEKKVDLAVGFFTKIDFSDSVICQGQVIEAKPNFRYYNLSPKSFGGLDTNDYWFTRQTLAGQKNVEGYTTWDFSKEDDKISIPATIFGSMPYAKKGYRNPTMFLGNEPGGIYYRSPGRYSLRVAAADSNGCVDTTKQNIYVTGPRAGFYTDLVRPDCNTILELFDTSFIIDPCVVKGLAPCDFIYRWVIKWGDGTELEYLKQSPKQIGHDYTLNGTYRIWLIIESILGCRDSVYQDIFIPGPKPLFVPETKLTICVGDSVRFRNITDTFSNSSNWLWSFGDGFFSPQSDTTFTYHQYNMVGQFDVYLNQYDSIVNTGKYCAAVYPDLAKGQSKITVTVLPYDNVKLMANPIVVCVGDNIDITAALSTLNAYSKYNWTFDGKPFVTSSLKLSVSPQRKGKFMITWSADTIGLNKVFCPDYDSITVYADSVIADFKIDQSQEPVICFTNLSKYAIDYRWGFFHDTDITFSKHEFRTDDQQKEPDRLICKNFIDHPGINWVCLEATNSMGCKDTLCKKLVNDYEMAILPPNVFTPSGSDGFIGTDKEGLQGNNVFNIYTKNVEYYHLVIYDRWGVLIFESHDTQYDWNGSVNNSGTKCPDATYYYILDYRYKGRDKNEPMINGVVQLIW